MGRVEAIDDVGEPDGSAALDPRQQGDHAQRGERVAGSRRRRAARASARGDRSVRHGAGRGRARMKGSGSPRASSTWISERSGRDCESLPQDDGRRQSRAQRNQTRGSLRRARPGVGLSPSPVDGVRVGASMSTIAPSPAIPRTGLAACTSSAVGFEARKTWWSKPARIPPIAWPAPPVLRSGGRFFGSGCSGSSIGPR